VSVHTDLAITGKPAQFGRGVMQDVSDKLLGQFVACLEHRLGGAAPSDGVSQTAAAAGSTPPTAAVAPGLGDPADPVEEPGVDAGPHAVEPEPMRARPAGPPPPMTPAPPRQEALDLGATVLPVLARTYWKHALVLLLVVVLVVWLLAG
jgi:hypothetical protein